MNSPGGRKSLRQWADEIGLTQVSKGPMFPPVVYVVVGVLGLAVAVFNVVIGEPVVAIILLVLGVALLAVAATGRKTRS